MAVELKKTNRTLEAHAERLAQELDTGLKSGMDFTRLQELFVHSTISETRSSAKRNHFKRLDTHDDVMIHAKKCQNTYNTTRNLVTKIVGLIASLAAAGSGLGVAANAAEIFPLSKTTVTLLEAGSKSLETATSISSRISEVFTSREAGIRELLNAEIRSLHAYHDQLNSSEQQEKQRIETLLRKLDELLRQQQEAKKG